ILLASLSSAKVAWAQYSYVTDSDSIGSWDDINNWSPTAPVGGPNGVGVTATINQPIKSGGCGSTVDMPPTDVTVGQLTIDNANDQYATRITMANHGGRLVFEDSSGTAKYIETLNGTPGAAPMAVQNSIQM